MNTGRKNHRIKHMLFEFKPKSKPPDINPNYKDYRTFGREGSMNFFQSSYPLSLLATKEKKFIQLS
jgi:hypothetical protein